MVTVNRNERINDGKLIQKLRTAVQDERTRLETKEAIHEKAYKFTDNGRISFNSKLEADGSGNGFSGFVEGTSLIQTYSVRVVVYIINALPMSP